MFAAEAPAFEIGDSSTALACMGKLSDGYAPGRDRRNFTVIGLEDEGACRSDDKSSGAAAKLPEGVTDVHKQSQGRTTV